MYQSSEQTKIKWPFPGFRLWLFWVLATASSGTIGWAITELLAIGSCGFGIVLGGIVVGTCVGLAQGIVLGHYTRNLAPYKDWFLWVSERLKLDNPGEDLSWRWLTFASTWTGLTIVGMNLCLVIALLTGCCGMVNATSSPINSLTTMFAFSAGGLVFGLLQWLSLRPLRGALCWLPITAVGWGVGVVAGLWAGKEVVSIVIPDWGYTGIVMGPGGFLNSFVSGSVGAAVFGLITAVPLVLLLRSASLIDSSPPHKPSPPPHSTSPS